MTKTQKNSHANILHNEECWRGFFIYLSQRMV